METPQLNWITNFIWGIADDVVRDLYVRGKYRDVILPMTVLRRLDAVLEPTKQAVLDMKASLDNAKVDNQDPILRQAAGQAFYNTSKFTLRDLRSRANQQQLRADFEAYLDGFSPNVQDILDNFEFRNQIPRLSQVLPYSNAEWEKLSIFLTFLVPKLPAPVEEDLSRGILEAIDMDSYRVEKKAAMKIVLDDDDATIDPVPTTGGGYRPEPELDTLSNIIKAFNDQFGNISWQDEDRVTRMVTKEIPERVMADPAYQNAKQNSDRQNARIEHDKALQRVMNAVMKDDTELFRQFMDNESFRKWMADTIFGMTYRGGAS